MIKWKTALVELAAIGLIAGATWFYFVPHAPVTAPVTDSATFDANAARPTEAAPTPPRETASPIRTRRHGTRPADTTPTRSHATRRGSPDFWVGRPHASRRSDFCKQIPAIAYRFDRATIIQAMRERGVSEAKQAKVLACLNK
jgi:septal ring-binding cell division protein DamX